MNVYLFICIYITRAMGKIVKPSPGSNMDSSSSFFFKSITGAKTDVDLRVASLLGYKYNIIIL